ncbi:MAG: diguanylate cyclase [Dactylosporangium sp.]|nr:diguanylate cyclase [Dactylosporangium sp.]NNJ61035.1 diguanylate cyclase [Dactylosporangium sp.]
MLTGLFQTVAARGGRVVAIQTFDAGFVDYPDDDRFMARVAWQHIDALVVGQAAVTDAYLREFAQAGKPVVAVYRELGEFQCPTVVPDNRTGVRLAIDHLIEHGHRTIAFVYRHRADADEWIRYRAYQEIMLARGLEPCEPVLVSWQLDETYDATEAVRELRDRGPLPSAAVACTDLVAMAFVAALARVGVVVPDDMAVIGFDDIADAATFQPPLSTIAQNFMLAGTLAGDLAFQLIEGSPVVPGYQCTPVAFVPRESCGCSDAAGRPPGAAPADAEWTDAQFVNELTDAVHSGRHLTVAEHRALVRVTEHLTGLLTAVARTPSADAASVVGPIIRELRQLASQAPNPLQLVGAIRRFAQASSARLAPDDPTVAARCDRLVFDIAMRMLEDQNLNVRGRPIAYQDVEIQRRYYMIGTDLVRQRVLTAQSLDWLAATEFRAGCLALWESGRGNRDDGAALRIVSTYDRAEQCQVPPGPCDVTAFPPASFIDLVDEQSVVSSYLYVLPVRFAGSDWGFLALTGPLDVCEVTAFERYNHWVVLLTVALDHEHAIRSERALLEEIRIREERYALAAEAANDGLWDWNLLSGTVFYSSRWKSLLGCAEDEITATSTEWLGRIHPDDRPTVDRMLAQHIDGQAPTMELGYRLRTANGAYRWMTTHVRSMHNEAGRVIRLVGSMTDVTDRKLMEERLRRDAHYDPLTGLPNRTLFLDRLRQMVDQAHHQHVRLFAVVFLDLDGFKVINDSLGHQMGDEVLIKVAERLTRELRSHDTVARFGGDEFVLLLDDVQDTASLEPTVARILSAISSPLAIDGRFLAVSAAAGIAVGMSGSGTVDEYLRNADIAMYQAKAAENGNFALFDRSMLDGAATRHRLEPSMHPTLDCRPLP